MTSLAEMKERTVTGTPVLLFDCVFEDGATERWATHEVRSGGHDYEPRVITHSAFELRLPGEDALDSTGKAGIVVSNVDGRISQIDRSKGFKGAKLTVRFGFFNLDTREPETPLEAVFTGLGQPAEEIREDSARLSFTDRFTLARILQPTLRIQQTCPWHFPRTPEQRAEASGGGGEGRYSPFWKCGYSPDQADGTGSMNGSEPFTECARTVADCKQRGMYSKDSSGRATARFGGFSYLPASILVRPHGEKAPRWSDAIEGKARSNDPLPLIYGTNWIRALVNFSRSDGNLTHFELVLGTGQVNRIHKVLADGMEIPPGIPESNMAGTGWFNVVSDGNRNGGANPFFTNAAGEAEGDPHGGIATLAVAIPNRLLGGSGFPKFEVLLEGMILPRFEEDGTELPAEFTANPAWILLDIMRRSGWKRDEIDFGSFASAAAFCDETIEVSDETGQSRLARRFELNLALTERKSLHEIIRGIRLATGLSVVLSADGRLSLSLESGIGRQFPERRPGSNAVLAIGGGWPAYEFGDGTESRSGILVRNGRSTLKVWRKSGHETPNRLTVEFQDAFRAYQQTSVSVVDTDDERLQGYEIASTLGALGLPNFNQALRAVRHQLNKTVHGNRFAEFESGAQALGVRPGDLITLTVASEGLDRTLFRVLGVSLGTNHATVRIICREHREEWYSQFETDGTGSGSSAGVECGGSIPRVLAGRTVTADGRTELEIEEGAEDIEGGQVEVIARFTPPDPRPASRLAAPLVSIAPRVLNSGGSLKGGQPLYYGLTSVDEEGRESPLSFLVRADLPASITAGAVEITGLSAPSGAETMAVYRGPHPLELYRLASLPAGVTSYIDTGARTELKTPRDPNYDKAEIHWRFELLPESGATFWSDDSIGRADLGLAPEAYRGSIVRVSAGKGAGQERRIVSNTTDQILIEGKWAVIPDATSTFSIVEAAWKSAGFSRSDELRFLVPARFGQRIEVLGRSVSANGVGCPIELCPVTKHSLGGVNATDYDVPGEPSFALSTGDHSEVLLSGIGFESLENTYSITSGTLTLHYWDELHGPSPYALIGPALKSDTSLSVSLTSGLEEGQLLQAGREIMQVTAVRVAEVDVLRAQFGTEAEDHAAGATMWALATSVSTMSFPPGFFGAPASGSYTYRAPLPNARIAAAELTVRNRHGASPAGRNEYTSTNSMGMRTAQGSQITIQMEGTLSVERSICPPIPVPITASIYDLYAIMASGPVEGDVVVRVRANDQALADLTVADGARWSNVVSGFGLPPLAEGDTVEVDVLAVPTSSGSHPGRDLTVAIRL